MDRVPLLAAVRAVLRRGTWLLYIFMSIIFALFRNTLSAASDSRFPFLAFSGSLSFSNIFRVFADS